MQCVIRLFWSAVILMLVNSAAADFIQCPWGNSFVNVGSSIEQVKSQCPRAPQKIDVIKKPRIEIWIYHLVLQHPRPTSQDIIGVLSKRAAGRPDILQVVFTNNKVSSINSFGENVTNYSCPNGKIVLQDSPNIVRAACAVASSQTVQPAKNIQHWHYISHGIAKTLTFDNGVLQSQ